MLMKQVAFLYSVICFVQGEIDYDIIVPELICDKPSGLDRNQKKTTTIELVGDGKIDLFKVNFKRTGKPCRSPQRCNLIAWKVIRQFEKYLNNHINIPTNSIEFNNSMLIPDLEYILTVFVSQGQERVQKQITLNFLDDDSRTSKPLAAITLVGLSSTRTDIAYILNAEVNFCSYIDDFYFLWELLDESGNLIKILPDRSFELHIPPFTFQEGKKYSIKGCLKKLANDEVIAEKIHLINVLNDVERLSVKLPMVYTTVNAQQSIYIKPYVKDLKNEGDNIKKKWSCTYNQKNLCENNTDDELYIENGFLNEGEYNISLTVTTNAKVASAFALVKVLREIPSIEIDTIETPVLPSSGVKIKAYVEDLRTFCTVQWKSQGPYSVDLHSIPGNVDQVQHVITRRDLFLKELEEFSSDVVTKEYSLIIPPPLGTWLGLPNLEENYELQFLLEVKCPKAQLESNDIEVELTEDFFNDSITISALVEIYVVVAPKLQPLEVTPETGVALETVFTFQCGPADKTGVEYFSYRFGYVLGNKKIVFSSTLGFRKAKSTLPYSDAVQTFVEVCEESNSCATIFGPSINTTLPKIDDIIQEATILNAYDEKLNTEDFIKAFGYALSILTVTEEERRIIDYFSNGILGKIRYLLNTYDGDDENWGKRVNKFIISIKEFSQNLTLSEDVLNGLVELRDKLLMAQKEKLLNLHRNLLTTNKKKVTLENFKSYVEVSDLIITSSSDEKKVEAEKLLLEQQIHGYIGRLCALLYEKQQTISLEYQILILVVEKLPKKSYSTMHVIPFTRNPWNTTAEVKLDAEVLEKFDKDKLCIAKLLFKDYFNKSGISYGAYVLDGDSESSITDSIQSIVLMPLDHNETPGIKTPKCLVYNDGWAPNCIYIKQVYNFAEYSCSTTGIYHLDYEETVSISTIPSEYDEHEGNTKLGTEPSVVTMQSTKVDEITEKPPLIVDEDTKTTNKEGGTSDATSEVVTDTLTTMTVTDVTNSLTTSVTEATVASESTSDSSTTTISPASPDSPNPSQVVSVDTTINAEPGSASTLTSTTNKETPVVSVTFSSYQTSPETGSSVSDGSNHVTKELTTKESGHVSSTVLTAVSTLPSDVTSTQSSLNEDTEADLKGTSTVEVSLDTTIDPEPGSTSTPTSTTNKETPVVSVTFSSYQTSPETGSSVSDGSHHVTKELTTKESGYVSLTVLTAVPTLPSDVTSTEFLNDDTEADLKGTSTVEGTVDEISTVSSNGVESNDNEGSTKVTEVVTSPSTVLTPTKKGEKGVGGFGIFGELGGNFFANFYVNFSLDTK